MKASVPAVPKDPPSDSDPVNILFMARRSELLRCAFRILRNTEDAKDALQDTFLKLLQVIPDGGWRQFGFDESAPFDPIDDSRPSHKLRAWLFHTIKNRAWDMVKSRRLRRRRSREISPHLESTMEPSENRLERMVHEEDLKRQKRCLEQLPPEKEQILLMKSEGNSRAEMAAALDYTTESMNVRAQRALKSLRKLMSRDESAASPDPAVPQGDGQRRPKP